MAFAQPRLHPCQSCGACCAKWRVEFYWREAEPKDSPHPVPSFLFEEGDSFKRTLKGTTDKHRPRCLALKGKVGERVECSVYLNRPSPCRAFAASYENDRRNSRCDEARASYGLKPLRPGDWVRLRSVDPTGPFSEEAFVASLKTTEHLD